MLRQKFAVEVYRCHFEWTIRNMTKNMPSLTPEQIEALAEKEVKQRFPEEVAQ